MTHSTHAFPSFRERFPWWGPDLQTLRNVLRGALPSDFLRGVHEVVELPMRDGSGDALVATLSQPHASCAQGAPLIVLIHGLGGTEESTYMIRTARQWLDLGHAVLRLNLRGAGPSGSRCQFSYHAGRTGDLRDALQALQATRSEHVRDGLALVGYSLGGNMLLKFLAEHGEAFPIRWAASISAPIDLAGASLRFRALRNRLYQNHILTALKAESLREEARLSSREKQAVAQSKSVFEFDDQFVAPRNDYRDATEYYACNSAVDFLGAVATPTLVIHALNDPWIPRSSYEKYPWQKNPMLTALLARRGGHVGFHGRGNSAPWHDCCIERFAAEVNSRSRGGADGG